MKAKILAVVLTLVLVISCCPLVSMALPEGETVLIHQVYGGNQKGDTPFDRDFIELYNTGDEAVELDGYVLAYQCDKKSEKQAGGTDGAEVTLALDGYSIPAHTSFLVACAAETTTDEFLVCPIVNYDAEWEQAIYNKQYRVALYNGTEVVDAVTALDVAESEEAAGEGDPVLDISKQKAIRRVNFADTDNNAADFEIVKYEKSGLANLYNEAEYVAAYGPKSTADGEWTSTPTMAEDFIGYDFVKQGGYDGPYSSEETIEFVDDEGLTFDTTVDAAYMTAELLPQDAGAFKYAFVTIKTSEGMEASSFALTIGNIAKPWNEWIVAGTLEAATAVTDEFQTFVLDLEENGVTECVSATGADLAINKDDTVADEGTLTISTIRFSNKASLDTPVKNFLGYDFAKNYGFWGPYAGSEDMASLSYTSEGLLFDTSVATSYVTAELNPQAAALRKYAKVTIKTSDATLTSGEFSLTIGDVSKRWTDWTDGAAITEEFQTFVLDLEEHGATTLVNATGGDFALNKSTVVDDEGVLSIACVEFTNGSYELDLPSDDEPVEPPVDDEPAFVGLDFVNETGYWGPYTEEGMAEITEEGLVFDTSVTNSYATAEIDPQELPFYKYAYITIKVDDATKMTGEFSLTLGGVGKYWKDWTFAGGITNVALTEEFQTLAIDLEASGLTELVSTGNDFAINRSTSIADEGIITIQSIEFKDEAPEEDIEGTIVGYDFVNETGYWGPYFGTGMAEITDEGLTFDTSVVDSYANAELNPQETPFYKYAYITIKTSDAEKMTEEFSLTLGNATGKSWKDWTFADGTDGTLTEEFQTFVIDLEESGATEVVNTAANSPDFALNKSTDVDDEGIITIQSIAFKNEAPEVEIPTGPSDLYVSAVAPSVATVVEGEDTYFTTTIRNLGEYASEGYTVSFYLKGMLIETVEVEEAIEAGATARVSTTIAKNIAFGSNTIKVFVECENDNDDTNNIAKARFLVD